MLTSRRSRDKLFNGDSLREWIYIGKEALDEVFVHHRHAHAVGSVEFVETATIHHSNPECLKESGRHHHEG